MAALPKYRARKCVWAGKIAYITRGVVGWTLVFSNTFETRVVDDEFMARWAPDPQGYFMEHQMGAPSYMPEEQFDGLYEKQKT